MSSDSTKFAHWCVLEIMGHQRFAGYLTEITIAGTPMLQLTVPEYRDQPEFTRIFGGGSVYSISPCTEELARGMIPRLRQTPISIFDLPSGVQDLIEAGRKQTRELPGPNSAPVQSRWDAEVDQHDEEWEG